jgi:3-oxocholest-4-en-26-oyl-CoA dehydrogenase beta subunit
MDLTLGPEQEAVRDAIRGVLADRQSPARVRQVMIAEPAVDEALWHEAASLGWFGLALPEDADGAGYGLVEAALLFQEIGRGVIPGPWLGATACATCWRARFASPWWTIPTTAWCAARDSRARRTPCSMPGRRTPSWSWAARPPG